MNRNAVVKGIGHALPEKILTNEELSKTVDTTDEWIVQRTGIKQRRICGPNEGCFDLSLTAAREAFENSGLDKNDINMVIVATVSGDWDWPTAACYVQDQLGLKNAGAFDIGAACAGFIYAASVGNAMVVSGQIDNAIIVGVDTLSKQVNWNDRSTCILFGDGAGAVVLGHQESSTRGIIKTALMSDGSGAPHIMNELGGTKYPPKSEEWYARTYGIKMNGNEVYRFAIGAMGDACEKVLHDAGMTADQVDLFVPHQANIRIIESAAKRLNLPPEKVFVNLEKYGNTSAGSIPLALYEAVEAGRLKEGMVVMTVGFGAGLVWGANLIRW
ncbi:MAG: beta-ketoacyl-ACP synthase III [Armatimonadota bacterium]